MMHRCQATACQEKIPSTFLMCRKHWFMVPAAIRDQIWATYKNRSKHPSEEYMDAYRKAVNAVDKQEGRAATFTSKGEIK